MAGAIRWFDRLSRAIGFGVSVDALMLRLIGHVLWIIAGTGFVLIHSDSLFWWALFVISVPLNVFLAAACSWALLKRRRA